MLPAPRARRSRKDYCIACCVAAMLCFAALIQPKTSGADDWPAVFPLPCCCLSDDSSGCEQKQDEPKCSYGPCDCQPRKTLLQWSYGTSFSGGAPSMDEPLESDRPGFTVSTVTVGRGVVQLETGYLYTLDNAGNIHETQHEFPDTLWRIGMFADWFEWRIEYNYTIINDTIDRGGLPPLHVHQSGSEDLLLGCKIALTPQEGILPSMCLVPAMSVPTGAPSITSHEVLPSLIWDYEWKLNEKLSLNGLTAIGRDTEGPGTVFTHMDQALLLQLDLTKDLSSYVEWFVIASSGATIVRTQHYSDGGFAYHLTNNIQFDIEAGVGLNAAASNFFAGSGAVIRF
jgi:hypothetical protein